MGISKKIILLFLIAFIFKNYSSECRLNQLIFSNQTLNSPLNNIEITQLNQSLTNKILSSCKHLIPSSMLALCNKFKKPYLFLLKSEALALTYIICINSCEHNSNLIETILSPESLSLFITNSAPSIADGLIHAITETGCKNSTTQLQKIIGSTSIAFVSLNLICSDCFNNIPDVIKKLITSSASTSSINLIQNKFNIVPKISSLKKPIVLASIATSLFACSYFYDSFDSENIISLVPNVVSLIEKSVLYTYAYRLGKNILNKAK